MHRNRHRPRALSAPTRTPSLSLLALAVAVAAAPASGQGEPRRLTAEAFGEPVTLEVRDLPAEQARNVLHDAFRHLQATEALLAEAEERLNADPRTERTVWLEPPVRVLLERTQVFCHWSGGAVGPLGGSLRDHWRAVAGNPTPPPVSAALAATAGCDRMVLDPTSETVRVAAGSRVDLSPFAAGFAVDLAVAKLRELGSANGRVRLGRIERAFGPGPYRVDAWGEPLPAGWPTSLPAFEGWDEPLDRLLLGDGSLAVLWRADWPAGEPVHVDLRNGQPPDGVWATVVVTERAIDAQALAVTAMVLGSREGRFRMAGLTPEPSVLWLMGSGRGRPLRSDLNWSDVPTP
jgi:thiamine biosynthesis lipoprotein ApbE